MAWDFGVPSRSSDAKRCVVQRLGGTGVCPHSPSVSAPMDGPLVGVSDSAVQGLPTPLVAEACRTCPRFRFPFGVAMRLRRRRTPLCDGTTVRTAERHVDHPVDCIDH